MAELSDLIGTIIATFPLDRQSCGRYNPPCTSPDSKLFLLILSKSFNSTKFFELMDERKAFEMLLR
jgi:hypothetical protein